MKKGGHSRPGAYFVTVIVKDKEPLLGAVSGGAVALNAYGHIVQATWQALPRHYSHITIDACTVMPTHSYGIILIDPTADHIINPTDPTTGATMTAQGAGAREHKATLERHGLATIVRALKTLSANRINTLRNAPGKGVWGRGYYDHAICNDSDLERVRDYIRANSLHRQGKGAAPS